EIKHDGFRLMVLRDGARVRCFTRNGYDWADRFPAIVDAARTIKAISFLIDGEAVICRQDGISDFNALRGRRRDHDVTLVAFDPARRRGSAGPSVHRPQAAPGLDRASRIRHGIMRTPRTRRREGL